MDMRLGSWSFRCVLALALVAGAGLARAGGIAVSVADEEGAPLAGATVTISHEAGFVKTTSVTTDAQGTAQFPVLRSGSGYSIRVEFPGMSSIREAGLRVTSSGTTRVPIRLTEELQERVRITAARDVVDPDKTTTSTDFSGEFIENLPVPGRFYQNLLTLTPGVQDADGDGNPNVHGSRERDFAAIVANRRNVDPLTGQWMSRVNPNSIEEIEVITAGAGAEFGRAQGGFARIVQKQGSNRHEGVAEFYLRTSKLDGAGVGVASSVDDLSLTEPDFQWLQPAVQLTGPIIRDKLWYRFSHEHRSIEEPINVTSRIEITETRAATHSDQITWQVSPRNKLAVTYDADPRRQLNFGVSSTLPAHAALDIRRRGEQLGVTWTAPVSPRILVESAVGWQELAIGITPTTEGVRNDCIPGYLDEFLQLAQCRNLGTAETSGSYYRLQDDRSQRLSVSTKASVYAKIGPLSHELKAGFQVENERYFRDLRQQTFGTFDSIDTGLTFLDEFVARISVPEADDVRATGTNWSIYLQDQVKPLPELTVTVGARVDREEITAEGRSQFDPSAELDAYEGVLTPILYLLSSTAENAPLLFQQIASDTYPVVFTGFEAFPEFTQQLERTICEGQPAETIGNCLIEVQQGIINQKASFLQHVRRAEDVTLTNTNFSPFLSVAWAPGRGRTVLKAAAGRYYGSIPLIVPLLESEPSLTEVLYAEDLQTGNLTLQSNINPALTVQTVDRNLRTPYQDEITVKLERELWTESALELTYIRRRFRDQIQDININWETGDFGRCVLFGLNSGTAFSPGAGQTVQNPFTGDVYIDTDPGPGDGVIDDCAGGQVEAGTPPGLLLVRPDGVDDLYLQNPFWGDIFVVGNYNRHDYEAWELNLIRRQFRGWEMKASYTWSEVVGNGEDFFQELGNDPSLRRNVVGYQSYDQRHVVKLNTATVTPWGVRVGMALSWQSGLPYSLITEKRSDDLVTPLTDVTELVSVSGRTRQTFTTGIRNDQRNPSYWNVDLRLAKEMRVGKANLHLSAEIFNALDDDTYLIYNNFLKAGQQVNGVNEALRRFGRRWQLGAKLAW